jgi:branched-chain amino acid transport system permease protein
MKNHPALVSAAIVLVLLATLAILRAINIEYIYFVGYNVLQLVVLATAWNILGGLTGYVNFGVQAFFGMGAYAAVFAFKGLGLQQLTSLDLFGVTIAAEYLPYLVVPGLILAGALCAGAIGLATSYLTVRLRGIFFSIATLALAVVLQTIVMNWAYVGASRGAYVVRPPAVAGFSSTLEFLFTVMVLLAVGSALLARWMERSALGRGMAALRDDELAAECVGVPTMRLKLIATTISGAIMGMAGAIMPLYVTYVDPPGAFNLGLGVNSIAASMIGGTSHWFGPVIGGLLLGSIEQYFRATSLVTPELGLLIVGVAMVAFVTLAPTGLLGMWAKLRSKARS